MMNMKNWEDTIVTKELDEFYNTQLKGKDLDELCSAQCQIEDRMEEIDGLDKDAQMQHKDEYFYLLSCLHLTKKEIEKCLHKIVAEIRPDIAKKMGWDIEER